MRERAACLSWSVALAVLPLGHVTGLRNGLVLLAIAVTLVAFPPHWKRIPGLAAFVALLAWALASCAWSVNPDASWSKWRSDLLLPFLAYVAVFGWSRAAGEASARCIIGALLAGLAIVSILSAFAFLPAMPLDEFLDFRPYPGVVRDMPQWYPGPQDASFFAVMALVPILTWRERNPRPGRVAMAGFAMSAFIVAVALNRIVLAGIVATVLAYAWFRDPRSRVGRDGISLGSATLGWARAAVVALTVAVAIFATLEIFSRERLGANAAPIPAWGGAARELVAHDPRLAIWAHYFELGAVRPLTGHGYGRTVPAMASVVQPYEYSHAHNFFFDLWLELGLVGVAIFLALLYALLREALRAAGDTPQSRVEFAGLVALITAMLVRNMSDDLFVYGMAVLFWALAGSFLGRQRA